ncbi:DUF305 domain-containing protein [Streptomyces sp. MUM 203J]|uniref:DUF305 domain-containing protein n=1 Tax=Streptomyces sp. MUM 203J TaxID=2791990 RepID=UPI001F04D8A7|nr:DUF305 domain-containing protein [Streptomyces sp. MUM 203J]MCH0539082.1 DUF305 domain-containing protein [Streptomyces sp. MUM 203J]
MTRTVWVAAGAVLLALVFAGWATVTALGRDAGAPERAATVADDSADAGFARDMSVHHQQAVEMSFLVRDRSDDEDVRRLAYDIANTQANQRGMMLGWLDLWELPKTVADREPMAWMQHGKGHGEKHGEDAAAQGDAKGDDQRLMPGMATRAEMERLRSLDGKAAEVLFLQLMIDHHVGGVHMAQGCATSCEVPQQKRLAQGMVDAQESEIALMTDMLAERGAKPRG